MSTVVSTDCKAWVDRYALHGRLNAINMEDATDAVEETVFGDNTRKNKPGLGVVTASYAGFFEADGAKKIDDALQAVRGTNNVIVSLAPTTGAVGERCYTFRTVHTEITREFPVGGMAVINAAAAASSGEDPVPGYVLHNATVIATGTGTAVNIGAVASDQYLYAALHVLSASGTSPTLDVVVQSDADGDFALGATNRITFAQQTAETAVWATRVAGPITDTWWRASHTIGGTSPSFEYVLIVGII
jgi:hypothetical protein